MKFFCPSCLHRVEADSTSCGKYGKCPSCGDDIKVPDQENNGIMVDSEDEDSGDWLLDIEEANLVSWSLCVFINVVAYWSAGLNRYTILITLLTVSYAATLTRLDEKERQKLHKFDSVNLNWGRLFWNVVFPWLIQVVILSAVIGFLWLMSSGGGGDNDYDRPRGMGR